MRAINRKLTENDVRLIRAAYAEKQRVEREFSMQSLARKFDVHPNNIHQIITRRTFKWVQ